MFTLKELKTIEEIIEEIISCPEIEISGEYLEQLELLKAKIRAETIPEEQWQLDR